MRQKVAEKERGLELFKKVTGIRRSRELRREKDYDWKRDSFGKYHTDALKEMLKELREELKEFWQQRMEKSRLFDEPYVWQPWEDYVSIGPRSLGRGMITSFFPEEETVRLLVGLTENRHALDVPARMEVRKAFQTLQFINQEQQIDMLVTVIHPLAMPKLIDGLEGAELAELLRAAWRVETGFRNPESAKPGTVKKVAENIYRKKLERLADYCALTPFAGHDVIPTLKEHAGEKGPVMAREIVKRMEQAFDDLKRTLDGLRDGFSVTNP